jgi:hypothetical protein
MDYGCFGLLMLMEREMMVIIFCREASSSWLFAGAPARE